MAKTNPFRFSTKVTDEESGLVYYGSRYYQQDVGRWVNRDPIGEVDGRNLYTFVSNNPLNFIDDLGESKKEWQSLRTAIRIALELLSPSEEKAFRQLTQVRTSQEAVQRVFQEAQNLDITGRSSSGGAGPGDSPSGAAGNAITRKGHISQGHSGTARNLVNRARGRGGIIRLSGGGYRILPVIGVLGVIGVVDSFASNLQDFGRSLASGDSGMNLLDAATLASEFQTIGGDYFATYAFLDTLLSMEGGE